LLGKQRKKQAGKDFMSVIHRNVPLFYRVYFKVDTTGDSNLIGNSMTHHWKPDLCVYGYPETSAGCQVLPVSYSGF